MGLGFESQPNHEAKQKRSTDVERFFRVATARQELALVRVVDARKNRPARAGRAFALVDDGPRRKGKRSEAT